MYKLVLIDYSMPEMDGPQVAIALRSLFKSVSLNEESEPYLCCCTAYEEEAFMSGMNGFMTKPVAYTELE